MQQCHDFEASRVVALLLSQDGQTSDFEKVLKHQVELALDPFIEPDADDSTDEALLSRYVSSN